MTTYPLDKIEELLPGVWDDLRVIAGRSPLRPDPEMPKSKQDPSHSGTKVAEVADIQRAWKLGPLTDTQRRALLMVYGFDETDDCAAALLGRGRSSVTEARLRGLHVLYEFLNGKPYLGAVLEDDELEEAA